MRICKKPAADGRGNLFRFIGKKDAVFVQAGSHPQPKPQRSAHATAHAAHKHGECVASDAVCWRQSRSLAADTRSRCHPGAGRPRPRPSEAFDSVSNLGWGLGCASPRTRVVPARGTARVSVASFAWTRAQHCHLHRVERAWGSPSPCTRAVDTLVTATEQGPTVWAVVRRTSLLGGTEPACVGVASPGACTRAVVRPPASVTLARPALGARQRRDLARGSEGCVFGASTATRQATWLRFRRTGRPRWTRLPAAPTSSTARPA